MCRMTKKLVGAVSEPIMKSDFEIQLGVAKWQAISKALCYFIALSCFPVEVNVSGST